MLSVAVHLGLIALAMRSSGSADEVELDPPVMAPPAATPMIMDVTMIDDRVVPVKSRAGGGGGGGGGHRGEAHANPWNDLVVSEDDGWQGQHGHGQGHGFGTGIGLGDGGGVGSIGDLPAVPAPFVSKARPAKLLHPTRQTEVEDEDLFEAKITVDTSGDVVGAHMVKTHPGSHGDTASSMIWQFRYSPALDDDGAPVTSTFVQTFAVR